MWNRESQTPHVATCSFVHLLLSNEALERSQVPAAEPRNISKRAKTIKNKNMVLTKNKQNIRVVCVLPVLHSGKRESRGLQKPRGEANGEDARAAFEWSEAVLRCWERG